MPGVCLFRSQPQFGVAVVGSMEQVTIQLLPTRKPSLVPRKEQTKNVIALLLSYHLESRDTTCLATS